MTNSPKAMGQWATVSKTDELRALLASCLNQPGVHIIEVPVAYSDKQRVLIDQLQEQTCKILSFVEGEYLWGHEC